MKNYLEYSHNGKTFVQFNQNCTPRMFFVLLGQLDVYVHLTQSQRWPYAVQMTMSEFESCLELAKEI